MYKIYDTMHIVLSCIGQSSSCCLQWHFNCCTYTLHTGSVFYSLDVLFCCHK